MAKPIQIHYFSNSKGSAEGIRLILNYAGVDYEEVHVSWEEWPAKKTSGLYPFEHLPIIIESDGSVYAESHAIVRHLARVHGLAGKTESETTKADAYSEHLIDVLKLIHTAMHSQDKANNLAAFFEKDLVPGLAFFDTLLSASTSGFLTDNITYVDLKVFEFVDTVQFHKPGVLDSLTHLLKHHEKIKSIPQIAAYLASPRRYANRPLPL